MNNIPFKEIKEFFKSYHFTDEVIELNSCTVINDLKKAVNSLIGILESNSGNKRVMPYYNLLLEIYLKINNKWAQH